MDEQQEEDRRSLVARGIKTLLLDFDRCLVHTTKGAIMLSQAEPYEYYDLGDERLRNISDLVIDPDMVRKIFRYCAANRIDVYVLTTLDATIDGLFREGQRLSLKLDNFRVMTGEEMVFHVLNSIMTVEDCHYLKNFRFNILTGSNPRPKTSHKNHLVEQVFSNGVHRPETSMMIDHELKNLSDADFEWSGIQKLHLDKSEGLTLKRYGYLIDYSENLSAKIIEGYPHRRGGWKIDANNIF